MLSGLTLAVVSVVSYAPHGDVDAARLSLVSVAVKAAAKAGGDQVIDGAFAEAEKATRAGWRGRARWGFFDKARAATEEGRAALEHVELERAVSALLRAEQILTAERAWPGVDVLLAETLAQKGIALFELQREAEASAAFERAAALDRDVKLSEARVRPAVAAAFEKAAERARRAQGATERVELRDEASDKLARLKRAPDVEAIEWMCEALALDGVWIASASARGDGLAVVVQRIGADGSLGARGSERASSAADLLRAATVAMERARAASAATELLLVSKAAKIPPGATPGGPAPKKKKPIWERPWLWAGVLVGTSAIVLGVSLGTDSSSSVSARLDGGGFGLK